MLEGHGFRPGIVIAQCVPAPELEHPGDAGVKPSTEVGTFVGPAIAIVNALVDAETYRDRTRCFGTLICKINLPEAATREVGIASPAGRDVHAASTATAHRTLTHRKIMPTSQSRSKPARQCIQP